MRRHFEQQRSRRQLYQSAQIQNGHAIGEMMHHCEIVADEEIRQRPLLLYRPQQVDDLALDRHVERRQRLVGDDQSWVGCERPGDRDSLPLAAGEFVWIAVQGIGGETDLLRKRVCSLPTLGPRATSLNAEWFCDNRCHDHARIKRTERILENDLHRAARGSVWSLIGETNRARVGSPQTSDDMAQGGLAAPALANQRERLA